MTIALLDNPIQRYDWGSTTEIAALQGRPAADQPEAELWMGAYPDSSSRVYRDGRWQPLTDLIATFVDEATQDHFGPRLPFLMKFLAIARPLSIQSHPERENAKTGFEDGIFKDPYPKPELIYALSPIEMLCGFRPKSEVGELLAHLGREDLVAELDESSTGSLFVRLLTDPSFLPTIKEALHLARELPWLPEILIAHPNDPAGIAPLFLNHVSLRPGDAIFVPAERVHCYLSGFGVEVMGASDNVVRAGLTTKTVDIPLFIANVALEESTPELVSPITTEGWQEWPTPTPEFRLAKTGGNATSRGLAIFACTSGSFTARSGDQKIDIATGQAIISAFDATVEFVGAGALFRCSLGR